MNKLTIYKKSIESLLTNKEFQNIEYTEFFINDMIYLSRIDMGLLAKIRNEFNSKEKFSNIKLLINKNLKTEHSNALINILFSNNDIIFLKRLVKSIMKQFCLIDVSINDNLEYSRENKNLINDYILNYFANINSLYYLISVRNQNVNLDKYLITSSNVIESKVNSIDMNSTLLNELFTVCLKIKIGANNAS